jgi:putative transposase
MRVCCAILEAAQVAITVNGASFPTCYGPEYSNGKLLIWADKCGITTQNIKPEQPQQNPYIEHCNRTVRHEWLNQYIIENIEEAQDHATQ